MVIEFIHTLRVNVAPRRRDGETSEQITRVHRLQQRISDHSLSSRPKQASKAANRNTFIKENKCGAAEIPGQSRLTQTRQAERHHHHKGRTLGVVAVRAVPPRHPVAQLPARGHVQQPSAHRETPPPRHLFPNRRARVHDKPEITRGRFRHTSGSLSRRNTRPKHFAQNALPPSLTQFPLPRKRRGGGGVE